MNARVDHSGKRFGRLTVLSRAESAGGRARWHCACDCGVRTITSSSHLTTGHSKSCGCATREATAARNAASAKHGMWQTPEFAAWMSMLRRCYTPSTPRYADYGGRGITVCDEWRKDFKAFFEHVGHRPSAAHSLDRIRNSEGYKPGNVRWATDEEQNNNRRSNVTIVVDGVQMTAAQIARKFGLCHSTVSYRIKRGKTPAEVVAK